MDKKNIQHYKDLLKMKMDITLKLLDKETIHSARKTDRPLDELVMEQFKTYRFWYDEFMKVVEELRELDALDLFV